MKNLTQEEKINRLTEFLDEQGQWQENYIESEDNINNHAELFDGENLFFGEIDQDLQEIAKKVLNKLDAYDILELCDEPFYHHGIHCCSNEIWSINIGEVEYQFSGIYGKINGKKTNCVYTELCKGLSDDEIKQAQDNADYCINGDCLYIDRSCDRVSICLNIEKFEAHCKKNLDAVA